MPSPQHSFSTARASADQPLPKTTLPASLAPSARGPGAAPVAAPGCAPGAAVMGSGIDALSAEEACARVVEWAAAGKSRTVAFANVHSVVGAQRDPAFGRALASCDMVLPDGAPVAWALRRLGHPAQRRVCGPDLVDPLVARLAREKLPIFLLGSTPATLAAFSRALKARHPGVIIAGAHSPPFGEWSAQERAHQRELITSSGARVVLVGLGCPKQESWMASCRGSVPAVMLGLGAAFDFHAGTITRAPKWVQQAGMEWAYRWAQEPRRLTRRYLTTNGPFLCWAARLLAAVAQGHLERPAKGRKLGGRDASA